jgi:uncharacterized integral membrane protein
MLTVVHCLQHCRLNRATREWSVLIRNLLLLVILLMVLLSNNITLSS